MSAFKKGDVVQLKSGGPKMTVVNLGDYSGMGMGPENGVACTWFDEKHKQISAVFDAETVDQVF